ncbi:MAG: BTAD domain-containing putative transcriptional regulator [Halothermotrichaceae bacterium]
MPGSRVDRSKSNYNYKFNIPDMPGQLYKNQTILKKFDLINKYPLTIIKAGPGYGKTVLLSHWLTISASKDIVCWYFIEKINNDPIQFWINLIDSLLINMNSDKIFYIKKKLRNKEIDIDTILSQILDEISCKNNEIYIILDDYHIVKNHSKIKQALDYFIDNLPSNCHLLIISRTKVEFSNLVFWKMEQRVLIINESLFKLNSQQIKEYFQYLYNLDIVETTAEKIYNQTEGWLPALNYLAHKTDDSKVFDEMINNGSSNIFTESFYKYFNIKVLKNMTIKDKNILKFLIKTSILEEVSPDVCNELLGIKNSSNILDEITTNNFFVYKIANDKYRYHKLLKSFLNFKVQQKYDINNLYYQVGKACINLKYYSQGLPYIKESGKEKEIAETIISMADYWIKEKHFDLLKNYLEKVSTKMFDLYPSLYMYRADLCYNQEKFTTALKFYKKAEREIKNTDQLIMVLFKLSRFYIYLKHPEGSEYLKKIGNLQNIFDKNQFMYFIKLKIFDYLLLKNDVKKAEALFHKYKDRLTNYKLFKSIINYYNNANENLNWIDLLEDNQVEAELPYIENNMGLVYQVFFYLQEGKFYHALELIWKNIDSCNGLTKMFLGIYQLMVYRLLGVFSFENLKNRLKNRLKSLTDVPFNQSWHKGRVLLQLALQEAFYGNLENCLEYCNQGIDYIKNRKDNLYSGYFQLAKGIAYLLDRDYEMAEKYLEKAAAIFKSKEDNIYINVSHIWLHVLKYRKHKGVSKIKTSLKKTLISCRETIGDKLLMDGQVINCREKSCSIPLLIEARQQGLENDYINKVLRKVGMSDISYHPGYSLRIESLGEELIIYRGKDKITSDCWKRKKAKELFTLLLVYYGRFIHRDKIIGLLWPEKNAARAYNSFYVTLNYLNNLLEPDRDKKKDPFFISKKSDRYGIIHTNSIYYDVEQFKMLVDRGKNIEEQIIKIKYYQAALQCYQRDFIAEESYLNWVTEERKRLRNKYIQIKEKVMINYFKEDNYKKCIRCADDILDIDIYYENAYLYKMKSYNKLGQNNRAVRVYRECKDILNEDLDIEPSYNIIEYYQKLTI